MQNSTGYKDIVNKLFAFTKKRGIRYGLDSFLAALLRHQNPHHFSCPVFHVAGTNGKGSTVSYLKHGLESLGYKVAAYTSPHLHTYLERFYTTPNFISEPEFSALFSQVEADHSDLTEFELLTLMAFLWFQQHNPDVVILETGLGGRLDATNVVPSSIALITSIGFDHQDILGDSLEKIASEKAGIIKPYTHVILGSDCSLEAQTPIINKALGSNASVCMSLPYKGSLQPFQLNATYQRANIGLSLAALSYLLKREIPPSYLYSAVHPGRFEIYPGPLILDCAHNPDGIKALSDSLKQSFPGIKFNIFLGILKRKYHVDMIHLLRDIAKDIILYDFSPPDSISVKSIQSVEKVLESKTPLPYLLSNLSYPTVFTGSIYFIDQVRSCLQGDIKKNIL